MEGGGGGGGGGGEGGLAILAVSSAQIGKQNLNLNNLYSEIFLRV